jgi:hypothetical protein
VIHGRSQGPGKDLGIIARARPDSSPVEAWRPAHSMTSMHDSPPIHSNSLWMMTDQVVRQTLGLAFSVWIARQYGLEGFGILSFALSFCIERGEGNTAAAARRIAMERLDGEQVATRYIEANRAAIARAKSRAD